MEIGLPRLQRAIIVFRFRVFTKEHSGHIGLLFDLVVDLILLFNRFVDVIEDLILAKASSVRNPSLELGQRDLAVSKPDKELLIEVSEALFDIFIIVVSFELRMKKNGEIAGDLTAHILNPHLFIKERVAYPLQV